MLALPVLGLEDAEGEGLGLYVSFALVGIIVALLGFADGLWLGLFEGTIDTEGIAETVGIGVGQDGDEGAVLIEGNGLGLYVSFALGIIVGLLGFADGLWLGLFEGTKDTEGNAETVGVDLGHDEGAALNVGGDDGTLLLDCCVGYAEGKGLVRL